MQAHTLTARQCLQRLNAGTLTAQDLVQSCLARITLREPELRAWEHLAPAAALVQAARIDAARRDSVQDLPPLAGLPIGVKDVFDTEDMPTGHGSPIYAGHRPGADSSVVAMLREAGAIVLGKTVSTEFAAWPPARTRHPRDPAFNPGGSSAGSAAAVADGMVPLALGTQTLGSVIRPASFCGIVGFKPSFGRINRQGVHALAESLDTVGLLARCVDDVALLYQVLADAPAPAAGTTPPRLAVVRGPDWAQASPAARAAFDGLMPRLRDAQAHCVDITLGGPFEGLARAAKVIHDFEVWRTFARERLRAEAGLSDRFRAGLAQAARFTVREYEAAVHVGDECRRRLAERLEGCDAAVSLAAADQAPRGFDSTGDPVMNSGWTLLYGPCLTLPLMSTAQGMPIGLQVTAPRFRDDDVLRCGRWLQDRFEPAAAAGP